MVGHLWRGGSRVIGLGDMWELLCHSGTIGVSVDQCRVKQIVMHVLPGRRGEGPSRSSSALEERNKGV